MYGAAIFKLDNKITMADVENSLHTSTSPKLGYDNMHVSRQGAILGGHAVGMKSLESKRISNVGIGKYFNGATGHTTVSKVATR